MRKTPRSKPPKDMFSGYKDSWTTKFVMGYAIFAIILMALSIIGCVIFLLVNVFK